MTINDTTEVAYNNGYDAGYEDGKRGAAKHNRCRFCGSDNNDFIQINETVEYSGIELSINRQGMLRVRFCNRP